MQVSSDFNFSIDSQNADSQRIAELRYSYKVSRNVKSIEYTVTFINNT